MRRIIFAFVALVVLGCRTERSGVSSRDGGDPTSKTQQTTGTVAKAGKSEVSLPKPRIDGPFSLERALKQRRSARSLAQSSIDLLELGQLCWATQGVTDDRGHRTASSAFESYPLELYVLAGHVDGLTSGIYRYRPETHGLSLMMPGDLREKFCHAALSGQDWIVAAPAILVLSGTAERMRRVKDRARQYMLIEAGVAAQNFLLEVEALGLASTFVGGVSSPDARLLLGLPTKEEVLAVLPVGHRLP